MNIHCKPVIALIILASLSACALKKPRLPEAWQTPGTGPSVLVDEYRMAVADNVQINVWKNPELSIAEPIRPDGRISVPLIGEIMAVGKTPAQLSRDIESRLSVFLKNPKVAVILTSLQGQEYLSRIRITGAVASNKSFVYYPGLTVLDAVLEAGSVTIYADSNRTKVHRITDSGTETYDIRLEDIMEKGDMRTNILLRPGDIITVPESIF
jgi:polysaccharide export outer membrane protein